MSAKTGFMKVLGRTDFVVRAAIDRDFSDGRMRAAVTYLDFTSGPILLTKSQKGRRPKKSVNT